MSPLPSQLRAGLLASAMALALATTFASGCGGRPWGMIVRSAQSELRPSAQVRDRQLRTRLRTAIVATVPGDVLDASPYVYMEHGFVVGKIDGPEDRAAIEHAARSVDGLRSLTFELVEVDPAFEGSDLTIAAEIKALLTALPDVVGSRFTARALNGRVVLLGIAEADQTARVREAIETIDDVLGVDSHVLEPEPGYSRRVGPLR